MSIDPAMHLMSRDLVSLSYVKILAPLVNLHLVSLVHLLILISKMGISFHREFMIIVVNWSYQINIIMVRHFVYYPMYTEF